MVSPILGSPDMANTKKVRDEVNDRVALAQARIEAAVAAIQSGSQWRNYLKLESKLHRYSTGSSGLSEPPNGSERPDPGWPAAAWNQLPACIASLLVWSGRGIAARCS